MRNVKNELDDKNLTGNLSGLALAIRKVRTQRGKTMAEFADLIGCTQSTISRYESGQLIPSRSILILILQFANAAESKVILNHLEIKPSQREGWTSSELTDALSSFEQYLNGPSHASGSRHKGESESQSSVIDFAKAARETLIGTPAPDSALVDVLRLWVKHRKNPRVSEFFRQIAAYLEVELSLSEYAQDSERTSRAIKKRDRS